MRFRPAPHPTSGSKLSGRSFQSIPLVARSGNVPVAEPCSRAHAFSFLRERPRGARPTRSERRQSLLRGYQPEARPPPPPNPCPQSRANEHQPLRVQLGSRVSLPGCRIGPDNGTRRSRRDMPDPQLGTTVFPSAWGSASPSSQRRSSNPWLTAVLQGRVLPVRTTAADSCLSPLHPL